MIDSNAYYIQVREMMDKTMQRYDIGINKLAYLMGMEPHHLNNLKNRNNWNPSIAWLDRIPPRLQRAEMFMERFTEWATLNNVSLKLDIKNLIRYAMESTTPEYEPIIAEVDEKHAAEKREAFREVARERAVASKVDGSGAIVSSTSTTRGILTPDEFVKMMVEDLEKGQ